MASEAQDDDDVATLHGFRDDHWDAESMRTLVNPGAPAPHPHRARVRYRAGLDAPLLEQYPTAFTLRTGIRSKPWATLYMRDSRPYAHQRQTGPKNPMKAAGGDLLQGVLELDLDSPLSIVAINLTLKAKVVAGYLDHNSPSILNHTAVIWDRSQGHPGDTSSNTPFAGKFAAGRHQIPVSFCVPSYVNIDTLDAADSQTPNETVVHAAGTSSPPATPSRLGSFLRRSLRSPPPTPINAPKTIKQHATPRKTICPLPPTFLEKSVGANTRYELSLTADHGRLRNHTKIRMPMAYAGPAEAPPALPPARQLAYTNHLPTDPGPADDPSGWCTLAPVLMQGLLDNGKTRVDATLTLSIALPLSYARGTTVPMQLAIACADRQLLARVAAPALQRVRLTRTVRYAAPEDDARDTAGVARRETIAGLGTDVLGYLREDAARAPRGASRRARRPASAGPEPGDERVRNCTTVSTALWWVHDGPAAAPRRLEGRIALPETLHPSCAHPAFQISYTVELLLPALPGFEADVPAEGGRPPDRGGRNGEVLCSREICVVTKRRPN